jgi:hypothetical protein
MKRLCSCLCLACFLVACESMKQGHGKIYASGSATQDAGGQTSGTVTGGVEYNFAKYPKNGYSK